MPSCSMRAWSSTSMSSPNWLAIGGARELRDLRRAVVRALADADEQEPARLRPTARGGQVQVDRLALLALQLLGFDDGADEPARGVVDLFEEALVRLLVLKHGHGQSLHVGLGEGAAARLNVHVGYSPYPFRRSFNWARVSRSTVRRISVSRLSNSFLPRATPISNLTRPPLR